MTILERKAFISSNPRIVLSSCPPPCGHFSIQESASGGLSYKASKAYSSYAAAGEAADAHVAKYPAHADKVSVFYCEKSSCQ